MLTSISPLGERARGNRFRRTAAAYTVGSLLGGLAIGGALGALGDLAGVGGGGSWRFAALAALAVTGAALDAAGWLPTVRRQVDERWLDTYRWWVYGGGFGFQLGLGVVTIVTASATYVALAAALLSGSAAGGAVVGLAFGGARALPLLATSRVRSTADLATLHRRMVAAARPVAAATAVAQVAVAVAALAVAGVSG